MMTSLTSFGKSIRRVESSKDVTCEIFLASRLMNPRLERRFSFPGEGSLEGALRMVSPVNCEGPVDRVIPTSSCLAVAGPT